METKVSPQIITGHWCITVITVRNSILKRDLYFKCQNLIANCMMSKIKRAIRIHRTERSKVIAVEIQNISESNFLRMGEIKIINTAHSTSSASTAIMEGDIRMVIL